MASLNKALEAAPDSPKVAAIRSTIQRFIPLADAQSAVAKIKVDLEKAKGAERATLLDKMIDARGKLSPFIQDRAWPGEMEQLAREIIQLDPENKTGLKRKYEFRVMLAEATSLFQARQPEKAQSTLDKALSLPGLTGEETQEAQLAKGGAYFGQKELPKALACFKKALEAAPDGPKAILVKALIRAPRPNWKSRNPSPRRGRSGTARSNHPAFLFSYENPAMQRRLFLYSFLCFWCLAVADSAWADSIPQDRIDALVRLCPSSPSAWAGPLPIARHGTQSPGRNPCAGGGCPGRVDPEATDRGAARRVVSRLL